MYPLLFSPITINRLEIKNRIAYPSMGLLYSHDGAVNDRYRDYFREKARGGAGIVTVGPVRIDWVGGMGVTLSLADDRDIAPISGLARVIKEEGARAWIQLFHAGGYAASWLIGGERPIGPSEVYNSYSKETPRAMTLEEVEQTVENFIRAAERAREAGFDGVEVIASAGYLITQFLSPIRNVRTDRYGGSFENRTRFPREVLEGMRRRLGRGFPISVRMAGNDFIPGSNTDLEAPDIARVYEAAGADLINVTGGWHEARIPQLPMRVPRGAYSYLALNIKRAVSVPVMASNRIATPREAERIIGDGMADMVNLGRVLLADPYWPRKAFEGRENEIRPCIACNQGCTDTIFNGEAVFCVVNPRAGYEGVRNIKKTASPKKVVVAGAGPGGLEAAVCAAEAGHRVELYERGSAIGGQLRIAGAPPHKEEIFEIIRYYEAMLAKHRIPVHLNTALTGETVACLNADAVIVAEGAAASRPPIEGADDASVLSSWSVLAGAPVPGEEIAVIGGGAVGMETAHFLAAKGTLAPEVLHFLFFYEGESVDRLRELVRRGTKRVTIFEMQPRIGADVGRSTRWVLAADLERLGVHVITGARVTSIRDGVVSWRADGCDNARKFDAVVMAAGSVPVSALSKALADAGVPHVAVGDCVKPRRINDAIHEAFLAVMRLGGN